MRNEKKVNENAIKNANATQDNASAIEKALTSEKVTFAKREAKTLYNISANIASVTSKSARIFLKPSAFEVFSEHAKTKDASESFKSAITNASKDRKGVHKFAITASADAFKDVAKAFAKYESVVKEAKTKAKADSEAKKAEKKQTANEKKEAKKNAAK